MAAVPGVGYGGQPQIDPKRLPGYGARPRVRKSSDGEDLAGVYVTWELPGGETTSLSPVASHTSFGERQAWADVLRQVYEALELPGTPSDYHFALLRAYELLWKQRRESPEVLPHIERLCLLDIALVENRPETVRHSDGPTPFTARVPAFSYLTTLYEREGFLNEALTIARRAADLGQGDEDFRRLAERVRDLRSEDA
jgi:hypothetical protein